MNARLVRPAAVDAFPDMLRHRSAYPRIFEG